MVRNKVINKFVKFTLNKTLFNILLSIKQMRNTNETLKEKG